MHSLSMSDEAIREFLAAERIVRVAFDAAGERYLIPLGYVWQDGALCCLTTPGRKSRLATLNPRVSFQVDDSCRGGPFEWTSVTGEAVFEVIDDPLAVASLLPALYAKFPDVPAWARQQFVTGKMLVARIQPTAVTGRRVSQ
jgi:nitroimidazol reductase NimA-like FMN-containing flavoprotein (pyridoxamine 5'-phosphate oxidase superfamily)